MGAKLVQNLALDAQYLIEFGLVGMVVVAHRLTLAPARITESMADSSTSIGCKNGRPVRDGHALMGIAVNRSLFPAVELLGCDPTAH